MREEPPDASVPSRASAPPTGWNFFNHQQSYLCPIIATALHAFVLFQPLQEVFIQALSFFRLSHLPHPPDLLREYSRQ
jgi:hypothetical protein